jgi:xylulokinase
VPAAPARLWLDRRALEASEQVSALMGGFVDASFFLPKTLDIKLNEPLLYEKTKFFLGCPEVLAYAITGEARTVFPSEGFERWFWNNSILEYLAMDKEKFPLFIRPGDVFGLLNPQIADFFGFKPEIPVISGGPDFFTAILGAGVVKPGQVCDRTGTSEGINACTEKHIISNRLMSYSHPVKPFWNISGIISTAGKAIEWGAEIMGLESYENFFKLAQTAQAGAGGLIFLPYLTTQRAPDRNTVRGILRGFNLSTGQPEFTRSILEGLSFAIRDIIEVMEKAGAVINELRVTGALSGNALINQIKADIIQKPVLVSGQKEAELLGLAIIGSCTLGKYSSFSEAASALVQIKNTWLPNMKNAALYNDMFKEYQQM